jgi:hypothetical protein
LIRLPKRRLDGIESVFDEQPHSHGLMGREVAHDVPNRLMLLSVPKIFGYRGPLCYDLSPRFVTDDVLYLPGRSGYEEGRLVGPR